MNKNYEKKVLVVDDEADVRNYLSSALKEYGFNVETASDGFEALESIKKEIPDLISLDLVMPKHSGIKFYRDLQKNKEWAKIPVLIVTGHARDDLGKVDFDTMMMQGPGVYLEKPVKPENYIETVCQLLNIEIPDELKNREKSIDTDELRSKLAQTLAGADADTLKKALELLDKKNEKQ
ncbi:response regulator [Bacteroidetes/Chlorobi group bacterium ChocPot_Mid]|jgi:CheY-like chemotaxis protein|nr:MAG: response regulator [Bacteroidetes/Chlorobi group bacterium ChocPot_Mid]